MIKIVELSLNVRLKNLIKLKIVNFIIQDVKYFRNYCFKNGTVDNYIIKIYYTISRVFLI
jgi:hypothetical protein